MGFISFTPPPFDLDEWKAKPHLERIKPLAQDWAVNGFGTPTVVYLIYVVKLVVFCLGALLVISTTPGIGGLGDFGDWWNEPIVFQKLVVWTLLWEFLGIGSGSMPLTFRFSPLIGGCLYWLRPGTVRLPPWPDKVPFTAGNRRTVLDVALYAGVLASGVYLLFSDGPLLDDAPIAILLGLLTALGLRDKVPFLASRPEVYGFMLLVGLFGPENFIVAWQLIFFCIWWGAASSKLNRHFPYVVSVMIANTPWNPSSKVKSQLWRNHPEDVRPGPVAALSAHLGTVIEFSLPLVLILSHGGTIGTIAVVGMVLFHFHILSTFALGVPLEWNIFMIFGVLFLFGHYGEVPLDTLDDPLLIAMLLVGGVGIPLLGNLRPDLISFLPSMRYYAGNWATSQWLFRKDGAEDKFDERMDKVAPVVVKQLAKVYGDDLAEFMLYKGLSFRAMHSHGRALNGLLPRAVDDVEAYHVREGEFISGIVTGWNFGDGHFHDERLLAAVQEQVGFEEGELRIVYLESQPAHVQRQQYRIYDAATGLVEEGWVDVADMVKSHPWLDETGTIPVHQ
jgi:hypothetical protein